MHRLGLIFGVFCIIMCMCECLPIVNPNLGEKSIKRAETLLKNLRRLLVEVSEAAVNKSGESVETKYAIGSTTSSQTLDNAPQKEIPGKKDIKSPVDTSKRLETQTPTEIPSIKFALGKVKPPPGKLDSKIEERRFTARPTKAVVLGKKIVISTAENKGQRMKNKHPASTSTTPSESTTASTSASPTTTLTSQMTTVTTQATTTATNIRRLVKSARDPRAQLCMQLKRMRMPLPRECSGRQDFWN